MVLTAAKDVSSNSIIGHQWLGKTIAKVDGNYVGQVAENKIYCSLRNLEQKSPDPGIVLMRAVALMVEATWTEPLQSYIRKYVWWLIDEGVKPFEEVDSATYHRWLRNIPTLHNCKKFWLGLE
jgi:hypothetical protein